MSLCSLQDIRQRRRDYLQAVEPIARERAQLAMMFTQMTFFPATGEISRSYSPEIQAIDDKYAELTTILQAHFLGAENKPLAPAQECAMMRGDG